MSKDKIGKITNDPYRHEFDSIRYMFGSLEPRMFINPHGPENRIMFLDLENLEYLPEERAPIKSLFKEIKYRIGLAYDCLRHGRGAID